MPLSNERRSNERRHLFVVRVWYEPDQALEGQWRGSVEHVPSGHQMYFVSLADMTDFIALHMRDLLRTESSQATLGDPIERN